MEKLIRKGILLLLVIVGLKGVCLAGNESGQAAFDANQLVLLLSIVSIALSVITLILLFLFKRQTKVDLVNTTEDMHLTIDSLKTTLSKDIKNVRKEVNRNHRHHSQRQNQANQVTQAVEPNTTDNAETTNSRPAQNRRIPHKKHYSRGRGQNQPRSNESENTSTE